MKFPKLLRRADDHTNVASAEEAPATPGLTTIAGDKPDTDVAATEVDESGDRQSSTPAKHHIRWARAIAYALLPGLALSLAVAAGFLKWQDGSARTAQLAATESVRTATESTIALLSYRADSVEKDLEAARSRLTGKFLNAYTSLTHDVVIPGAKQKHISASATVSAAAPIEATGSHAVVLLLVNQTVTIGQDAPTNSASSVRVTLDKVDGRWLIAEFDPI
jgi:Mce-associated membrane protein